MLQPRSSSLKIQLLLTCSFAALILLFFSLFFLAPTTQLPKSTVTVFPQGRKIAAFDLTHGLLSKKMLLQHWTFLFFGFTHCSQICPVTLTELKKTYTDLHAYYPELQVIFITLDPKRDQQDELKRYLASFHKDFIALRATTKQLEELKQPFGVFSEKNGDTANSSHTGSLFLINPQGQWTAIFPNGLTAHQIEDHFKTLVKSTSHA